jgi:hypothetical protein
MRLPEKQGLRLDRGGAPCTQVKACTLVAGGVHVKRNSRKSLRGRVLRGFSFEPPQGAQRERDWRRGRNTVTLLEIRLIEQRLPATNARMAAL